MMAFNIAILKDIPVKRDDVGGQWILFNDVKEYLNLNRKPHEPKIKCSNLFKWLKGKDKLVKEIDGKPSFSVCSVLSFFFSHANSHEVCFHITRQIQKQILTNKSNLEDSIASVQDIYTAVSKASFLRKEIPSNYVTEDTSTINLAYKEDFTHEEWAAICFFEMHFAKTHNVNVLTETYESLLSKKADFLKNLQKADSIAQSILKQSKGEILNRIKRKECAELDEAISLTLSKRHSPEVLEVQIMNCFEDTSLVERVICVDCTKRCKHLPSIHIYVEMQMNVIDCFSDIVTLINSHIVNDHKENYAEVIFFQHGSFVSFKGSCGEFMRFHLRDQVLARCLEDKVMHRWIQESQFEDVCDNGADKCPMCYSTNLVKPLSVKEFEVLYEWYVETPIMCQIIFEAFLNRDSFRRNDNKEQLMKNKYTRLYSQYDALLNIYNKKYCGVLQDVNTQDLTMNYQSVSTVFRVTSASGATQCLSTAEQKLKKKAVSELTYYNTYLKKFQLTYISDGGVKTEWLNLRECILILMMDNLVRLKRHGDPDPGENRSMQLCTLPLTIKGMPKDVDEIDSWHDVSCNGQVLMCNCKQDVSLQKDEIDKLLITLSEQEESSWKRFCQLYCWGHTGVWKQIFKDELHLTAPVQPRTDDLEMSFASLHLENPDEEIDHADEDKDMIDGTDVMLEPLEQDDIDEIIGFDLDDILVDSDSDSTVLEDSFIATMILDGSDDDISEIPENLDGNDSDRDETHLEQTTSEDEGSCMIFNSLDFHQYKPPPLITKHPPPALGRDDDIKKLKEVLDDVLLKTDNNHDEAHKIIFAPDHKIAANLLRLQENNVKYRIFLPEFPVLHLRKSKITILCSAYKDAGILHILKYMRDEEFQEWKKLISAEHIEMATRYIRRLAVAFHMAFFCKFLQSLPMSRREEAEMKILTVDIKDSTWEEFQQFMGKGRRNNGTFALHYDMMQHCTEVGAISFSERLGGRDGYMLMLAAVKSSLPFSYLNGASSYAAFTTRLLFEHFRCGHYYKRMKETLFTTPNKDSDVNFGLDTQREMDHKDALKAFRSGSTLTSILPRMSLLDSLNEVHKMSFKPSKTSNKSPSVQELLGMKITDTDLNYITRIVSLLLRQGGITCVEDANVYNVYDQRRPVISATILDTNTEKIGHFLIKRFVAQSNLFGCTKADVPELNTVEGPRELIQKLKSSKGVTMKRMSVKHKNINRTERERKEEKRHKLVKQEAKRIDCFSSEMNACQAVVKPDCSKPKVSKSSGIKNALIQTLVETLTTASNAPHSRDILEDQKLVYLSKKRIPADVVHSVTMATIEFAGVKFKTQSTSGAQYLRYVENGIIMKTKIQFPNLRQLAICEEKYHFTPDDFKAATRTQRQNKKHFTITHLKTVEEILTMEKFDKLSIVTTSEGKNLISTYLARNVEKLNIPVCLIVDIDSEYKMSDCQCNDIPCVCTKFTNPIRAVFPKQEQLETEVLYNIKQTKGEAEMAQIDWLMEYSSCLQQHESCASIVTSGDIDAVVLHMFALEYMWPRLEENSNSFKNDVFVILQKPGNTYDIYNITAILNVLETVWKDRYIGQKVALILSLGGNDYLPKFHGLSHQLILKTYLHTQHFLMHLFKFDTHNPEKKIAIHFDIEVYKTFIKYLYCSKTVHPDNFTYGEVRQMTIRSKPNAAIKSPQSWMPPETAIEQLAKNVNCLISYYLTAGIHSAPMPNVLTEGCLVRGSGGGIEYDLGPDAHIDNIERCLPSDPDILHEKMHHFKIKKQKRKLDSTPQKGRRRKVRPLTSTPRKR